MLRRFDHFRSEYTRRTVESREGLVELSHLSADRGIFFDYIDLEARVGDVKSCLNTRDASADDERAFCDGRLSRGKRSIKGDLCHGGTCEHDSFKSGKSLVFMYPRALFTDVGDFYHIWIQPCRRSSLSEGVLVHTGRA